MSTLTFEYRAIDQTGAAKRGIAHAANSKDAIRKITAAGLTPVSVLASSGAGSEGRWFGRGLIRTKDLSHLTYQMGVLVSARIPISQGLIGIADQEHNKRLKAIITDLATRIESGEQVAAALSAHRAAFGDVYIATVKAAEKSGNLPKVLDMLSDTLERNQETARQVRSALMYPVCIVGVLAIAMFILIGFVVPKFASMFEQRGLDLPIFTRALMTFGESIQSFWWAYLLGACMAVFGLRRAWGRPHARMRIDQMLHMVPYLRDILKGLAIARFCRVFGLSLSSGLGLIDALELASGAAGRPTLAADAAEMMSQVRAGGRLSAVLQECEYLTPFAQRMLIAGEKSAELPRMCEVVSRHYDRETTHLTKNISTVIEPVLIVAIAGVVLVVALAIFLPMWDMVKLVG